MAAPVSDWESSLIEPGPPPIVTDNKILMIHNGRAATASGPTARGSTGRAADHRPGEPEEGDRAPRPRRSSSPMTTRRHGQVNNVVFFEGLVHFQKKWFLYFGEADSVLGAAVWDSGV